MDSSEPDGLEDLELVRLYQADPGGPAGRRAADVLLRRWRERIYLWCHRMVRDHDQAMDLAQDCLVRVHRALPRFEPRAAVSSWIFLIVRNRCLTALRARPLRQDSEVDLDELHSTLAGPEETIEHRDQLEHVMRAMADALEPIEQRALWLRARDGMSVEEITRLLGITGASGARNVLQSARQKLRAALERARPAQREDA
jgi:RNA polymerase sigma-70 factor (ECF subfamily)